jgi:hypothetical protein
MARDGIAVWKPPLSLETGMSKPALLVLFSQIRFRLETLWNLEAVVGWLSRNLGHATVHSAELWGKIT